MSKPRRSDTYPKTLPCGCKIKNQQGAWIAGKYAPTTRLKNGDRVCRCGRKWRPICKFEEIK